MMRILLNYRAKRKICHYLKNKNIDIIHTNVSNLDVGIRSAKLLKVPHVLHFREYADLYFGQKYYPDNAAFLRLINHTGSYKICITKALMRYYHFEKDPNTRVIYDGVFPERKQSLNVEKKDYLLFVGRVEPGKRLLEVLKAYKQYYTMTQTPWPLLVAGGLQDPNYYDQIKQFISDNSLSDCIIFKGVVNNVNQLMAEARAVIVASEFEGFGRVLPEAMFNGTLTIGYDYTGTKEQFDNGLELSGEEIGLRYHSNEELANILCDVTASFSTYHEYVDRAFMTVNNLYTEEASADKIAEWYNEICKK